MPEQPLDHIERHALVHQETGERVTHIDLRLKGGSVLSISRVTQRDIARLVGENLFFDPVAGIAADFCASRSSGRSETAALVVGSTRIIGIRHGIRATLEIRPVSNLPAG